MRAKIRKLNLPEKVKGIIRKPVFWAAASLFFILVLSGATYGVWTTQQAPKQPIQFPHTRHLEFGVPCLYCHPGAWRQASAGLPTSNKCWGCHQQIVAKTTELQKLANYVQSGEPIPWVPVAIMPDFVYFIHRPHIAAGLNCETCHGEISQMTVAMPQKMTMGWCLECHRTKAVNNPVKLTKLTDCATCHR